MTRIALLACLVLTGCAMTKTVQQTRSFNAAQAQEMMRPGHNIIDGSALIRQNGGGVVTCAGMEVSLTPATDYATERMLILYKSTDRGYLPFAAANIINPPSVPPPPDPEYLRQSQKTMCDSQGKFQFSNVTDGSFYITTQISWMVGYNQQGGMLMKRVDLKGQVSIERVVLSP